MTQAGPAIPVIAVTDRSADGGPALRVAVVSDGRPIEGGPARPVIVVSDGRPTQGNEPLPVVLATGVQASQVLAGPAMAVVVVSGSLGPSGPAAYALLRDAFTDTANPMIDGPAQPGAGTRDVTGTRWYTELGKLFGGSAVGETVWGNGRLIETPTDTARLNGRTLWAVVRPEDRQSPLAFSWATVINSAAPLTDGHGWAMIDGSLDLIAPSKQVAIDASIHDMRPMLYLIGIVQLDAGAAVLISTVSADGTSSPGRTTPWAVPAFPSAAIAYITRRGTATPLYPSIQAKESPAAGEASQGHTFDDVRVEDVASWAGLDPLATFADRFPRTDGAIGNGWIADAGTWSIVSNQAKRSVSGGGLDRVWQSVASSSDGIFQWTVTTAATYHVNCLMRRRSATEYIRLTSNGDTRWALQVLPSFATIAQSGVLSDGSVPFPANTTRNVVVFVRGNNYFVLIDDIPASLGWLPDAGNNYLTDTGIGMGDVSGFADTLYDNVAFNPLTVTLPTELQQTQSLAVFQRTAGATLGSDLFTDPNGTLLTAHVPTSGPAWTVPLAGANATIQSNRLSLGGAGAQLALQSIGSAYHECQVDIILPGSLGNFTFAGICVAYVDVNNWFVVRLAADYVAQPLEHEIEVLRSIAGVVTVVGKVQFGVYFVAGNTVALKTQVVSDGKGSNVVLIYLGGTFVESYYMPVALNASVSAGMYRDATTDSGAVLDAWSVKTL